MSIGSQLWDSINNRMQMLFDKIALLTVELGGPRHEGVADERDLGGHDAVILSARLRAQLMLHVRRTAGETLRTDPQVHPCKQSGPQSDPQQNNR